MRFCKRICLVLLIMLITITPTQAAGVSLFKSNIGKNKFENQLIHFEVPHTINQNWYPLRETANYLPIKVEWDASTREIVVVREDSGMTLMPEFRIKSSKLNLYKDSLRVVQGVTYCSGEFLIERMYGISFEYKNVLYVFDGELKNSTYIKHKGNEQFKARVNTSLYQLYLNSPNDYAFVKKYLTGGIEIVKREDTPIKAIAYVYSKRAKPICYIVGSKMTNARLASVIAHEAMHVYQARIGNSESENKAQVYQNEVYNRLR